MEPNGEFKLFCGSSNPKLGKDLCAALKVDQGKIILKKFSNGETYVQFLENVRAEDVFLLQTAISPINDYLIELLIMIDAAKRSSAGRITVITPNYFYARQDRKTASREPITAKLVANLITAAGADRMVTMDLHSDQLQGFFDIPLDNLPARQLFIKKAKEIGSNSVVVSPDAGSLKASTKIAEKLGLDLAIINKARREHNSAQALGIVGASVLGKNCLIFDDIVDTAGSLCAAIELLKKEGALKVYAFVTHGILSGKAIERISESSIEKLFVTDTLPMDETSSKIEVISISEYLAKAIHCIHYNESVSKLFE
ncbi:MAG: ribose-phosphate pyrophosphokinase [archaeon]